MVRCNGPRPVASLGLRRTLRYCTLQFLLIVLPRAVHSLPRGNVCPESRASIASWRNALYNLGFLKHHHTPFHIDIYRVLCAEFPFENLLRERIFDLALNRALQWPRAVHRIETRLGDFR